MISEAIDFRFLLLENYKKLKISENQLAIILMIDHLLSQGNPFITADLLSLKMSLDRNILCTVFNGNKNNHIIKYNYDKKNLTKIFEKKKANNNPIFNCIKLSKGNIVYAEGRRNADSYEIKFWQIQKITI